MNTRKMTNKGQGAMEYLMTYGWAILVVMIVGVVLWQLGIFSGGSGGSSATGFVKLLPVAASVYVHPVGASTQVNFTLSNAAGQNANVAMNAANLTDASTNTVCPAATLFIGGVASSTANMIPQGGSVRIDATGCPLKAVGDSYDYVFTLTYTSSVAGVQQTHIESGHLRGKVE